jgi:hypothetical protein
MISIGIPVGVIKKLLVPFNLPILFRVLRTIPEYTAALLPLKRYGTAFA